MLCTMTDSTQHQICKLSIDIQYDYFQRIILSVIPVNHIQNLCESCNKIMYQNNQWVGWYFFVSRNWLNLLEGSTLHSIRISILLSWIWNISEKWKFPSFCPLQMLSLYTVVYRSVYGKLKFKDQVAKERKRTFLLPKRKQRYLIIFQKNQKQNKTKKTKTKHHRVSYVDLANFDEEN